MRLDADPAVAGAVAPKAFACAAAGASGFRAHFAGNKPKRQCILFFVSLGEHYVEIIADDETHSRVRSNIWNKTIDDFTATVTDGLLGAIESCSAILKTHYPHAD